MTVRDVTPPGSEDGDDAVLIRRLQAGEARAFDALVTRYGQRVFRQALFLLGSVRDAEDATQEVFEKVFRSLPAFQGDRLCNWLLVITRHHCIDVRRKEGRQVPRVDHPSDNLLVAAPRPMEAADGLPDLAILTLPEREVVHMRVLEHLEYRDIAELTGYAEGSLRNLLSQALRKLREAETTR